MNPNIMRILRGAQSQIASFIVATGGTITTNGNQKIHTFTSGGTFEITSGEGTVDYLIAAGGGGGGSNANTGTGAAGGGGAGGLLTGTTGVLTVNTYGVTVGAGGAGGATGGYNPGSDGSNSSFNGNTSTAGGGGGSGGGVSPNGRNGGSGGGAGATSSSPGLALAVKDLLVELQPATAVLARAAQVLLAQTQGQPMVVAAALERPAQFQVHHFFIVVAAVVVPFQLGQKAQVVAALGVMVVTTQSLQPMVLLIAAQVVADVVII